MRGFNVLFIEILGTFLRHDHSEVRSGTSRQALLSLPYYLEECPFLVYYVTQSP